MFFNAKVAKVIAEFAKEKSSLRSEFIPIKSGRFFSLRSLRLIID
jgi:hypothetical protein